MPTGETRSNRLAHWGQPLLLAFAGLGLALVGQHILFRLTASWDWNLIRLERSFALVAGYPLFSQPDQGLILNQAYGPVAVLFYLPATLAKTPTAAILVGQLLALAGFFLPALWLHWRAGPPARVWRFCGFLVFVALTLDLWPLTYSALTVHVDAPALGLGALAAGCLLGPRPPTRAALWVSLLAAVLALWTKQVMAPLVLALELFLLAAWGWRLAVRYGLGLLLVGSGSLLLAGWSVGGATLWFHLITVPVSHPWRWGGGAHAVLFAFGLLLQTAALAWALTLLAGALLVLRTCRESSCRASSYREDNGPRFRQTPGALFWMIAGCNLPMALLGRLKVGGDDNALSFSVYFLVLGTTLTLAAFAGGAPAVDRWAQKVLLVLLIVLVPFLVWVQEPGCLTSWQQPLARDLPQDLAFRYAQQHPGEIYFPRLVLASYLAEDQFYHSGTGLVDRLLGKIAVAPQHVAAHLPARLRAIALAENGYLSEMDLLPFAEFSERTTDPELPGFAVFVRP